MYSLSILYIWASLNAKTDWDCHLKHEHFIKPQSIPAYQKKIYVNVKSDLWFSSPYSKGRNIFSKSDFLYHWLKCSYLTTSPNRTLRLFLTHLLILILSSVTVSSESTIQTVSFLRLPFNRTVSPLNSCSSSIFF